MTDQATENSEIAQATAKSKKAATKPQKEPTPNKTDRRPSVLACERRMEVSDGIFSSGSWSDHSEDQFKLLPVEERGIRGLKSNRGQTDNADANLQTVDAVFLPNQHDTLRVDFTVRFLPGAGIPSSCNERSYSDRMTAISEGYKKEHGFVTLGERYAANIANGRALWRNRAKSDEIRILVDVQVDGEIKEKLVFNAMKMSLNELDNQGNEVKTLGRFIAQALRGEIRLLLKVSMLANIGAGQEVYPSQEMILVKDEGEKKKTTVKEESEKKKVLYRRDGIAAFHSQKLGNALRTVDTWYAKDAPWGPIPLEPYGAVSASRLVLRNHDSNQDFYSLLDNWVDQKVIPDADQQHYIMGVFIRGGVFS